MLLTVEHGRNNGPLVGGESDLLGVVRQREDDDDVAHHGKEAPDHIEPDFDPLEQVLMERDVDCTDGLVSVAEEQAGHSIDDEGDYG